MPSGPRPLHPGNRNAGATPTTADRGPYRILVVDDSATARDLICALIAAEPRLLVCGTASDGRAAISAAGALAPDLITMDLHMPVLDGLSAISEIMDICATRILVVSDVADASNAMAAIARGALDATYKPNLDDGPAFTARLRLLAGVPVIRHLGHRSQTAATQAAATGAAPGMGHSPSSAPAAGQRVGTSALARGRGRGAVAIAIAVSTGGPQALALLLPQLCHDLLAPVLIAQHISDGFAAGMAQWLDGLGPLPVTIAVADELARPGRVYLADPSTHMTLDGGLRIRLQARATTDIYRPSCDRLLTSVAAAAGPRAIGVILTGMGRDGARGMAAIAAGGGVTIAQDEASSVVFGMNREAIMAGVVQQVLPLEAIAAALIRLTGCGPAGPGDAR